MKSLERLGIRKQETDIEYEKMELVWLREGQRDSYWRIYYYPGILLSTGHCKKGKKFGTRETYHINGQFNF